MRLIDADLLEPDAEYDDGEYWAYSKTQIENAPTIELIRCKDCKYSDYPHCNRVAWWNGKDDFCSRAERKEGEAE